VYPGPKELVHGVIRFLFVDPYKIRDETAPPWGYTDNDEIESTTVITARAVRYYYDLSIALRKNPDMPSGFQATETSLNYSATMKRIDHFSHAGDAFDDVYVADLNLEWRFRCGAICGMGFTRNKIVVLARNGDVLALYLDNPVNSNPGWVS